MAVALHVYAKQKGAADDAPVDWELVIYASSEAAADTKLAAIGKRFADYAEADADDRVIESVETIDDVEIPAWEDVDADDDDEEDGEGDPDGKDGDEDERDVIDIPPGT